MLEAGPLVAFPFTGVALEGDEPKNMGEDIETFGPVRCCWGVLRTAAGELPFCC